MDAKEIIAARVAKEFKNGDVANLGIGLPTMIPRYLDPDLNVTLQSENGYVGLASAPVEGSEDPRLVNAGGMPVSLEAGGAFFDSNFSFNLIRGGHIDVTILGALQVSENGDIANWIVPGKIVPGMGGAMDLVVGAKRVIVAMEHTNNGKPKIMKDCTLPLTAKGQVNTIVTEMGVMEVTPDGLVLKEHNPAYTLLEVVEATACDFKISDALVVWRNEYK